MSTEEERILELISALDDKNQDVRLKAALELGTFGKKAKTAIRALDRAMIQNRNKKIKFEIAYTLFTIDGFDGFSYKELKEMKKGTRLTDEQKAMTNNEIKRQLKLKREG